MTARFSMSLGDELNEFATAEAKRIGITKTAFIAMCVDNAYRKKELDELKLEASALYYEIEKEMDKKV